MVCSGAVAHARMPAVSASFSNSARLIELRKSWSSCMPSTEMGASLLALRISLVLRTCLRSLLTARGDASAETEGLCASSNSVAKWSTSTMSMSSPPHDSSHATALISNWPCVFFLPASLPSNVLYRTSAAPTLVAPMSYTMVHVPSEVNSLSMPHCNAAALRSETSARMFKPAMSAASYSA